jgi:hypothetical protein
MRHKKHASDDGTLNVVLLVTALAMLVGLRWLTLTSAMPSEIPLGHAQM